MYVCVVYKQTAVEANVTALSHPDGPGLRTFKAEHKPDVSNAVDISGRSVRQVFPVQEAAEVIQQDSLDLDGFFLRNSNRVRQHPDH